MDDYITDIGTLGEDHDEEIEEVLNLAPRHKELVPTDPETRLAILKAAQNANRGGLRKGEERRPGLAQLNIKCQRDLPRKFRDLSLMAGRTQRQLLEEAYHYLYSKYKSR